MLSGDRDRDDWNNGERRTRTVSRRAFLRAFITGAGMPAIGAILAACGVEVATPTTAAPTPQSTATGRSGGSAGSATPGGVPAGASPGVAATTAATGSSGGQVSVHWSKPVIFSPLFSTTGAEQGVEQLILGALVKVNDKLEAIPDIASKIDVSADAKEYTFTLKKGLTFTDGTPLTARDVVFTIERAVDKRTGSYWRGRLLLIDGATEYGEQKAEKISGLTTPDDYTVKMTLASPDSTWLLTLGDFAGLGILPAHILQSVAPDKLKQHPFSLNPNVSAGVFQFGKYEADQYLEIRRNENYGGGPRAKLDRIFFKTLTTDVALAQLEKGEIDLMIVPVSEVDRVKKSQNLLVASVPSPSIDFLTLNLKRPHLQDKRMRQAMMYAIDREAIVKEIFKGEGQVVNQSIIGPDWMGMPVGVNDYRFNPDKARQLLKEANWDSGRKIETILTPGDKLKDAYAPIIQQQCKDVGIDLDLRILESAEYTRKRTTDHDFEIAFVGGGIFRQDPNVSGKYFETVNFVPSGANYSHYSNPRVDQLFEAGRATTDQAMRKKIYTEIATILNDEVPWIFLWSPNSIFGVNKRLQGFRPPSYATHHMWNAEEWSVTQ